MDMDDDDDDDNNNNNNNTLGLLHISTLLRRTLFF
jgi:hypothetical protein